MREYRARRPASDLCWEAGCTEIADTYCPQHREAYRLSAVRRKAHAQAEGKSSGSAMPPYSDAINGWRSRTTSTGVSVRSAAGSLGLPDEYRWPLPSGRPGLPTYQLPVLIVALAIVA